MAFKILGRDGIQITTAGATADNLSAEARRIINVSDPVDAQDAATRSWVIAEIAGSGATNAVDAVFRIVDDVDSTKRIAFSADAISTSTTRTMIMPDADVNLGLVATAIQSSEKGAPNGVATLDGTGKIPASQLTVSAFEFLGNWDADTNSPSLADGVGNSGDVYYVSVAGTTNFGSGAISFAVGDWAYYDGVAAVWRKADNVDDVTSVNGQTGAVSLTTDSIPEGASNFYYTSGRFDTDFAAKSTDDLSEGVTNLYFTEARVLATDLAGLSTASSDSVTSADSVLSAFGKLQARTKKPNLAASTDPAVSDDNTAGYEVGSLWYNQSTNKLYIAEDVTTSAAMWQILNPDAPVTSVNGQTGVVSLDSDDISEGVSNLYFTEARARTAVVDDAINDGVTDKAPSQNAVFDALALKADSSTVTALDGRVSTLEADTGRAFEAGVAGEAMAANNLYLLRRAKNGETAGRYYLAQADSSANSRVVGFVMIGGAGVIAGDPIRVYKLGEAALGSSDTLFGASNINDMVYLHQSTPGKWTLAPSETAGSWIKEVGVVGNTGILEFLPGLLIQA